MVGLVLGASAIALFSVASASAHSGGTDRNGCHAGSRPYHCHSSSGSSDDNGGRGSSDDNGGAGLNLNAIVLIAVGAVAVTYTIKALSTDKVIAPHIYGKKTNVPSMVAGGIAVAATSSAGAGAVYFGCVFLLSELSKNVETVNLANLIAVFGSVTLLARYPEIAINVAKGVATQVVTKLIIDKIERNK